MKKRTVSKIIYLVLSFALIFSLFSSYSLVNGSYAKSIKELENDIEVAKQKQKEYEDKQAELEKELKVHEADKAAANEKKQVLEEQISVLNAEISELNDYISTLNSEAKALQNKIEKLEEEFNNYYGQYRTHVRDIYEKGNRQSYLEIILGAENFGDMLKRIDYVTQTMRYNNGLMTNMKNTISEVEASKAALQKTIDENEAAADKLRDAKSVLDNKKAELNAVIAEINGHIAAVNEALDTCSAAQVAEENAIAEAQYEINRIRAEQSQSGGGNRTPSGDSNPLGYIWPLSYYTYISSYFGPRSFDGHHDAVDIAAPEGTPIYASASGVVYSAGWTNTGGGNRTIIDHGEMSDGNYYMSFYCHQSSIIVSAGDYVTQGQVIGYVGMTGTATGNHLHFKITKNGYAIDPMNYISEP